VPPVDDAPTQSTRVARVKARVQAIQQSAMCMFTRSETQASPGRRALASVRRATLLVDTKEKKGRRIFNDPTSMKEKVRRNLMKTEYNIANFYKTSGMCQRIARSLVFDVASLSLIVLNAIWIGVDTDYNPSGVLVDAPALFQMVEHFFCLYFIVEWCIKVGAFEYKLNGFRDVWFCLDTFLACMGGVETWLLSIVIVSLRGSLHAGGGGQEQSGNTASFLQNVSLLRVLRLMRLLRMARLAKVFRSLPEIMVLVRAMATAVRTVVIALCFLLVCVYIFAVGLTQMSRGTKLEKLHFGSVLRSMHTLLVAGVFPDTETLLMDTLSEHFVFWLAVFFFMLFSAIAVMNMMIGVLVEVVKQAQSIEKEALDVKWLRDNLLTVLEEVLQRPLIESPHAATVGVSRQDFWAMLENPKVAKVLHQTGVDAVGLIDLVDFIYLERPWLPFHAIIEVILQLRSSNTATVRDLVDFRKYMTHEFSVLRKVLQRSAGERRMDSQRTM